MSEDKKDELGLTDRIDRAEHYVRDNKKSLAIIGGGALLVIASYFGYNLFIVKPAEEQARKQMFAAERYFGLDSLNLALKGDGSYPGFEEIVNEYGSSPSGNLAQYYLGMTYLKKAEYQKAIEALSNYDAEDDITGALALGGIAGANVELGNMDEALKYYKKAADWDINQFTRPLFLQKTAFLLEQKKDYVGALEIYTQIKKDFPNSTEAREIEKYIGRATALSGK
jgi:tetratricopeptide (TPR) repeat protein